MNRSPAPRLFPSRQSWAFGLATILITASLFGSFRLSDELDVRPGPNEYNIGAWEVRNFPQKWLFLAGEIIRGEPPLASQEAQLRRFFQLNRAISRNEAKISNLRQRGESVPLDIQELLRSQHDERDRIENQVESTIESRISAAVKDLGLTRTFLDLVWPPVDVEFTDPPRALVTSPRDRIELLSSTLLRTDLSTSELEEIENETLATQDVSALAFEIGGVGAYPAIVKYPVDYHEALRVAAHEWTHHYLFFRPLGVRYNASNDLRAINETVADLVGRELAAAVSQRWPLPGDTVPNDTPEQTSATLDLGTELRALRAAVDELLAAGQVDAAETLMEAKRQELVAAGFEFRKLNQAYFAFTNLYAGEAGSPAAVNPIGPKVDRLRRQSASLGQFVQRVSGVTSVRDLDRLLENTAAR